MPCHRHRHRHRYRNSRKNFLNLVEAFVQSINFYYSVEYAKSFKTYPTLVALTVSATSAGQVLLHLSLTFCENFMALS